RCQWRSLVVSGDRLLSVAHRYAEPYGIANWRLSGSFISWKSLSKIYPPGIQKESPSNLLEVNCLEEHNEPI
ncbi:MAG: hypothetical protein AB4426_02130, partial [Xenococcaceae cyanobacterium]